MAGDHVPNGETWSIADVVFCLIELINISLILSSIATEPQNVYSPE